MKSSDYIEVLNNLREAFERTSELEQKLNMIKYIVDDLSALKVATNSVYGVFANDYINNRWTPVSLHLPKKSGTYLVTLYYCGFKFVKSGYFSHGKWADDYNGKEVVAWMELPKPFEGGVEQS